MNWVWQLSNSDTKGTGWSNYINYTKIGRLLLQHVWIWPQPQCIIYKILLLWRCLAGKALKAIESLGHSVAAYQAAEEIFKKHLVVSDTRQSCVQKKQSTSDQQPHPGNSKDIKRYAVYWTQHNKFKEANHLEELKGSLVYMKLQKKLLLASNY